MIAQPYTALIKNELIEVKASSPGEAAKLAGDIYKERNGWLGDETQMSLFIEMTVFVGKPPEAIYNSCGIYAV